MDQSLEDVADVEEVVWDAEEGDDVGCDLVDGVMTWYLGDGGRLSVVGKKNYEVVRIAVFQVG